MGQRLLTILLLICVPGTYLARCPHVHAGDPLTCPVRPHLHLPFSQAHTCCHHHEPDTEADTVQPPELPPDHEDGTVDVVTDQLAERASWEPESPASAELARIDTASDGMALCLRRTGQVPRPPPRSGPSCPLYLQQLHLLV